ncbi:MAG: exonuclease SbcCD subunit D [Candidatus Thermoplasmatota archaeon]|nr:exonuclease SbcCD subunit D [Candidatus Thermoplasmatota archaeon]
MRLVHISDTHLGFSAYSKLDPVEGINQRESDVYRAFAQAVDKAIELEPDLVIHSGDLFDTVRPQNRAIDLALKQMIKLSQAGIETVLISGNHSTPRLRETGSILRIFEHLDHIHPVHEPGVTAIVVGDATVQAIPHSVTPSLSSLVRSAKPSKDSPINLLVLHVGVVGSRVYNMDEFNEQTVPLGSIENDWDYVALGHFHEFAKVTDRAYYSGSTERFGFGEAHQDKGIVEVDLDSHSIRLHRLPIRDMLDLEALDAQGRSSSEILSEARERVSASAIDDKVVRLVVKNVASDAYRSLDIASLRRLGGSALHFELKLERAEETEKEEQAGDPHIGLLADEFRKYIASLDIPDEKKSRLMALGMPYLEREEE